MNEHNAYYGVILQRFFKQFQNITYHDIPVGQYIYFRFFQFLLSRWSLSWAKNNLPYLQKEMSRLNDSDVYRWFEQPYMYDSQSRGTIIMRGGIEDLASLCFPADRFLLITPHQSVVDTVRTSRPDLIAHNIDSYSKQNPQAVADLTTKITQVIRKHKEDPLLGSPELLQWFTNKAPDIVRVLDAIHLLFDKFNISAVLTVTSVYEMDSALNLFARSRRIPSFTLQHGIVTDDDLFAHIPITATKKLVWGNETLDWYRKYGFPNSRVAAIGPPRFDVIFNRKWCGKQKLCQRLGIDPTQKIAVYATQPSLAPINIQIVLEGFKLIPDVFLLILLHPNETSSLALYKQMAAGFSNTKILIHDEIHLYDALSGADFFVTCFSTSALEAMLFKLPVISVEPSPPPFSYGELGTSLRITNSTELYETVTRLISDESFKMNAVNQYQDFISRYCIADGLASKRLFDEIERLSQTGGIT